MTQGRDEDRDAQGREPAVAGIVLAIDTCFAACSVAIGGGRLGPAIVSRFERMAKGQAERLLPMVAEVVSEANVALAEIAVVAVTVGPGSFTGTRIGIAAAKGLALAIGCRTLGVSSLHVIGRQIALARSDEPSNICVAIEMGRPELYVQIVDASGLWPRGPAQLVARNALNKFAGSHGAVVFEPASASHRMANIIDDFIPRSETVVSLVTQSGVNALHVAPLYLRGADALPGKAVGQIVRVSGT